MQIIYYIDTCIWLNLLKKEGDDTKGIPYWKIAEAFIDYAMFTDDRYIAYSGIMLRELESKLSKQKFQDVLSMLKGEEKFRFVSVTEEDYEFAREIESKSSYGLSFYDCLHVAVCRRLNLILITRDNLLIKSARGFIEAKKPEDEILITI
ncbi:MAG: PIN domain-containing protein [Candidatus Woesearchaeota archaeon]